MEQKGVDASSEFIGSQYTVVTVANVLNHCSVIMYGSTGIWQKDNVSKAPRGETQQVTGHKDKHPGFNDLND